MTNNVRRITMITLQNINIATIDATLIFYNEVIVNAIWKVVGYLRIL